MNQTWEIKEEEAGIKLQTFLRDELNLSVRNIRQSLEQNSCQINGAIERFGSTPLRLHDRVSFAAKKTKTDKPAPIFEDEHFLVINKPSYLTTDRKGVLSLYPKAIIVHRLDRDTTGILLLAKTEEAARNIAHQFRTKTIRKEYLALVDGIPKKDSGKSESYLGKKSWFQGQTVYGTVEEKKGSFAKTRWKVEKKGKKSALLRVNPITGKTHQIRVHLKEMGHPILGDRQYASNFQCRHTPSRTLLHAHTIKLTHPETGKPLTFKAPLPEDFEEALKTCGF